MAGTNVSAAFWQTKTWELSFALSQTHALGIPFPPLAGPVSRMASGSWR